MSVFPLNPVRNCRPDPSEFIADGLTLVDLELLLLLLLQPRSRAATEGENWVRSGERSESR